MSRSGITLSIALALVAFSLPARAASDAVPAWPATRAGAVAQGWVTAFNGGEKAMQEFLAARMAEKALRERPVPARIERYRDLREKYGRLQLDRIVKSEPYELTVKLLDVDAKSTEFVFKSEPRAPWKLVSVAIKQPGFHHGFGHPGH